MLPGRAVGIPSPIRHARHLRVSEAAKRDPLWVVASSRLTRRTPLSHLRPGLRLPHNTDLVRACSGAGGPLFQKGRPSLESSSTQAAGIRCGCRRASRSSVPLGWGESHPYINAFVPRDLNSASPGMAIVSGHPLNDDSHHTPGLERNRRSPAHSRLVGGAVLDLMRNVTKRCGSLPFAPLPCSASGLFFAGSCADS